MAELDSNPVCLTVAGSMANMWCHLSTGQDIDPGWYRSFRNLDTSSVLTEKWSTFTSVSKGGHCHQWLQPLPMVSPEGTQEGMNTCHLAAIGLQPLPMVSPEKTQDVKIQDTGPDSWGIYQRNDFSEPRLLYLPIQRKALNLGYLVFFNNNLLMFRLPTLCCKTSI